MNNRQLHGSVVAIVHYLKQKIIQIKVAVPFKFGQRSNENWDIYFTAKLRYK
jgi:hypothetical protein